MKSRYIEDVEIPDYDAAISESFSDDDDELQYGGYDTVIAIENHQHLVYRVIMVTGLMELVRTANTLHDVRPFEDLLADHVMPSKEGYDHRLRPI